MKRHELRAVSGRQGTRLSRWHRCALSGTSQRMRGPFLYRSGVAKRVEYDWSKRYRQSWSCRSAVANAAFLARAWKSQPGGPTLTASMMTSSVLRLRGSAGVGRVESRLWQSPCAAPARRSAPGDDQRRPPFKNPAGRPNAHPARPRGHIPLRPSPAQRLPGTPALTGLANSFARLRVEAHLNTTFALPPEEQLEPATPVVTGGPFRYQPTMGLGVGPTILDLAERARSSDEQRATRFGTRGSTRSWPRPPGSRVVRRRARPRCVPAASVGVARLR